MLKNKTVAKAVGIGLGSIKGSGDDGGDGFPHSRRIRAWD